MTQTEQIIQLYTRLPVAAQQEALDFVLFLMQRYGDAKKTSPLHAQTVIKPFPPTRVEDGIGCVGYPGPRKSIEEMAQGIDAEARRQWQQEDRS
jgi:hypothetical protein